jgi:lipoate-protein ligase A
VYLNVDDGIIRDVNFHGDYFGNKDSRDLKKLLVGRKLQEAEQRAALLGEDIGQYFHNMDLETFLSILLQ